MSTYVKYPAANQSPAAPVDSFTIIQTDAGTSPMATGPTDTLTFTSSDGSILITGNSVTDTVNFQAVSGGNAITALTGDGTATGPGSVPLTLATVNANVGSFGSASSVATQTVNAKGLTTAAASVAIQIAESQVTNLVADLAGKQPVGSYVTSLTGDVTGTGPGATTTTVAKIQSKTVSGTTGTTNVVFSASPTFTGTPVTPSLSVSTIFKNPVGATPVIDLSSTNLRLLDTSNKISVDWATRMLRDSTAQQSVDYQGRALFDPNGNLSLVYAGATGGLNGPSALWDSLGNAQLTWGDGALKTILTASRAVVLDASQNLIAATTTAAEIGFVNGVTSSIQTQLNSKASSTLTNTHIFVGNASNVATDVAMSGGATIANTGVVTLGNTAVTGQPITGFVSGAGTVAATDTILQAFNKINGNVALKAPLASPTFTGTVTISSLTQGSVMFAGTSGAVTGNNSKFFWDNTNFRLGLGLTAPVSRLHIDAGTATASHARFTAGTTTGQLVTDGTEIGITATGESEWRQHENLDTVFYNNNLETIRFKANNRVTIGNGGFPGDLDVSVNRTLASGDSEIGISILPQIGAADDGTANYFGLAIQPFAPGGPNGLSEFVGAFFSVNNGQDGTNGAVIGLLMQATYSGAGTLTTLRGVTASVDAGSAATDAASGEFTEPAGSNATSTALLVSGTISIPPTEDSSGGTTINALVLPTSFIYLDGAGATTLNGVTNVRDGKYVELYNATGSTVTVNNNNGSAAAGERILTVSGAPYLLVSKHTLRLRYYITAGAWLQLLD